ncbi:MarR family transcriptional regulator [Roseomonas nepalensis]|uniref:MarR family transcriptional regulator n=1 Tax=Muricoccus nepalensis TaxID=1854500 RepID=A0A502FAU0_9PROT|nr:MarR family transcriptional regulator [Roseomonas nepalensis]TPG46424.1 MarR family transcriptional regulator [Roseomonas nepalensis]
MPLQGTPDEFVLLLHKTIMVIIRHNGPNLTARQLGVFLRVYVYAEPQTGTDLALALNVHKGIISRALDRLEEAELIRREPNPDNYRSVLAGRTVRGTALFREIRQIISEVAANL